MAARAYNGKKLSGTVTEEFFELAADSPDRWRLHSFAIAAPDDETIDFILENSNIQEL
jgi:hypothetical protein